MKGWQLKGDRATMVGTISGVEIRILSVSGWDTAHVIAIVPGRGLRWSVNMALQFRRGQWVREPYSDGWCIMYRPRYNGDDVKNWFRTDSPPGSSAIIRRVLKACAKELNGNKKLRHKVHGLKLQAHWDSCIRRIESCTKDIQAADKAFRNAVAENSKAACAVRKYKTRSLTK